MASQVDIVNRALTKLGAARITSLADNNKQARVMTALWDTVRQSELRLHFWGFAIKRDQLASSSPAPSWGFANAYNLPADYLRIVEVNDYQVSPSIYEYVEANLADFSIENGQILTDFGAPLKIRYVRDITNPGQFDATFTEAFASKLAFEACEDLTQSNDKKAAALADYKIAIRNAVMTNAIEIPPTAMHDDSWVIGRL